MVSRQESARPLLTPGEVMQLPPSDALVMVSGQHPIRARKARYFEDRRLKCRVVAPFDSRRPAAMPAATGEAIAKAKLDCALEGHAGKDGGLRLEPEGPLVEDAAVGLSTAKLAHQEADPLSEVSTAHPFPHKPARQAELDFDIKIHL
jgi:type IV secretion system protein VirD4